MKGVHRASNESLNHVSPQNNITGNVLFNDTLNTFFIYCYMASDKYYSVSG